MKDTHDLRNRILGSSLERTMRYMERLEEEDLDPKVHDVFCLLNDLFPSGGVRDVRGASHKQLSYICALAGITDPESLGTFTRIINEVGGLDSLQAHHIINRLLENID
jgi:hypothetical protein